MKLPRVDSLMEKTMANQTPKQRPAAVPKDSKAAPKRKPSDKGKPTLDLADPKSGSASKLKGTPAQPTEVPAGLKPDWDAELEPRQALFVVEYLKCANAAQAAVRAGYSSTSAKQIGAKLLTKHDLRAAIDQATTARKKRLGIHTDEIIQRLYDIANADPKEWVQSKRVCCRHCFGIDHGYQYTPAQFKTARQAHLIKSARHLKEKGVELAGFEGVEGDWYDGRKPPSPSCPECFGAGELRVFISDGNLVKGTARFLFQGIKQGRDGVEIKLYDQSKAIEQLARVLGMFNLDAQKARDEEASPTPEELDKLFGETMRRAQQRQAEVIAERVAAGYLGD